MKKRSKGVSGITVGLIAAIIFITIILPLTVSYIVNTTNRFGAKSYGIEYQEYKILEEKGISACYIQLPTGDYIIRVNNTLGKPVIINLMYVKYGNNIETISTMNLRIEEKTTIPLNIPLEPNIIRLVSSSGAVINVPPCSQIVATTTIPVPTPSPSPTTITVTKNITYTDIIQYIVTERYPINVYWDEKQYPEGITPQLFVMTIPLVITVKMYLGYVLAYVDGYVKVLNVTDVGTSLLVNGTITPRKEWFDEYLRYALELFGTDIKYAPGFVVDTGPGNTVLSSTNAGDYLAMIVDLVKYDPQKDNGTDSYGFQYVLGRWLQYGSYFSSKPFNVKKLVLNKSYKYVAGNSTEPDPLKYILVNSGYDSIIVGIETEDFDPLGDYGVTKFTYHGLIYVNPSKEVSNLNDSKIIIEFNITETREDNDDYLTVNFDYVKIKLPNGSVIDWSKVGWTVAYREYFKKIGGSPFNYKYRTVLMDQIVFSIPENVLGISGGDKVYVWAEASFINPYGEIHDNSTTWISYTYMPVKSIVDSWLKE